MLRINLMLVVIEVFGVAIAVAAIGGFILGRYIGSWVAGSIQEGGAASDPTTCDEARAELTAAEGALDDLERRRLDLEAKQKTAWNVVIATGAAVVAIVALIVVASLGGILPASAVMAALLVAAIAAASVALGAVYELDRQLAEVHTEIDAASDRVDRAKDLVTQLCPPPGPRPGGIGGSAGGAGTTPLASTSG